MKAALSERLEEDGQGVAKPTGLKPQARDTAAGQPPALAAQAIPAGISPLVQNRNALKTHSLPAGRRAKVFFHSEAEFCLKRLCRAAGERRGDWSAGNKNPISPQL